MKHSELIRKLYLLHKALNRRCRAINKGGCAVMAGLIGTALKANGVAVEVVTHQVHRKPREIEECITDSDDMHEWDSEGLNTSHLAVRFQSGGREYTWDSDGLVRRGDLFGYDYEGEPGGYKCDYPFGDGLSVEACVAMSGQADAWNRSFDRSQIPLMESLVARYFGKPAEAHHG